MGMTSPAGRTYEFALSSDVAATADVVWAHATSAEGINFELFPLARMTFPRDPELLDPKRVRLGERHFRSWVLFLGFLPVEYDDLTLIELDPPRRFLERSPMLTQREWEHERTVEEFSWGTRVRDRIRFTPRIRALGAVQFLVFRATFALRHFNVRRRFGRVANDGERNCSDEVMP